MRVLLVGPDLEENLSIRCLASSLLQAGHEAVLAPYGSPDQAGGVLEEARTTDAVGLSMAFQVRAREFLDLARRLKAARPTLPVIAGGHWASCAARRILEEHEQIDVIVIHEGERTIVELAGALERGADLASIPGIALRDGEGVSLTSARPIERDLDALPWPDRRGPAYLHAGVPSAYLLGSRGCVGDCAYCCISTLHRLAPGPRFRQRRAGEVAAEMADLYHERGVRQFIFHDDNFLVPSRKQNLERLDAIETGLETRCVGRRGIVIKCRPQEADPDVFRRLREMGLVRVFLGVESACDETLGAFGRPQSAADAERALEICDALGISAQYTIMTFNPDATINTLRRDIAFLRRHIFRPLNFCRTEIYTATPLERRMIDEGRARGDYLARTYSLIDPEADAACTHALGIFGRRCWAPHSLVEFAIGQDHISSVLGHFYEGPDVDALRQDIARWLLDVNTSTVDLLEAVVETCAAGRGDLPGLMAPIAADEVSSRRVLLARGRALREKLDALVYDRVGLEKRPGSLRTRIGLARAPHAAAVLLALGIAALPGCSREKICEVSTHLPGPMEEMVWDVLDCHYHWGGGVCEYAAPPLPDTDGDTLPDECELTVFDTNTQKQDSDLDGVLDGEEDSDADGLTNAEEQARTGDYHCQDVQPEPTPETGDASSEPEQPEAAGK